MLDKEIGISGFTKLADLVASLHKQPNDRERYEAVFRRVNFEASELERYCLFSRDFYTRNLIARGEAFELLALCWEPKQVSPIHDHAGSDGWIHCARGSIEEVRYRPDTSGGAPEFERLGQAELAPGQASYINDDMAWHTVGNPSSERAVSLHLYSPPIDSCQYFDAARGTIETKNMSYFWKEARTVEG